MKRLDLTNQRFGRLIAIEPAPSNSHITKWKCLCDCGNEVIAATIDLRRGHTKSCGCLQREKTSKASLKNLQGEKFGYLEVLERDLNYQGKGSSTHWYCVCHKCNNIKSIATDTLRKGAISCGCLKQSKGEYKIMSLLQKYDISFISEYIFDDHKNRRFDFALLNKNKEVVRLIEFDGIQHYYRPRAAHWAAVSSLEETQQRDKEKNLIAQEKGIGLIRIPYWHLEQLTIKDLLSDRFLVKEKE